MSRIVGLIHSGDPETRDRLCGNMLLRSSFSPEWETVYLPSNRSCLAWTGRQLPNVARLGNITAVMDGFIYNREEWGQRSGPDAQLLLTLYRKYGFPLALERINGDFAAAVYDEECDTLWLARDRFGVKPLYFASDGFGFAFASRLSALLALPHIEHTLNKRFVALFAGTHYRYFDNEPNESPYSAVSQLPAAHILNITNGRLVKSRYWTLSDLPDLDASEEELALRYRDLLFDSVSIRLKRASRPAFTLSGGMDSSSVLGCAVKEKTVKQHAFSTVYDDKTYDESEEIGSMLDTAVEKWHPVSIGTPPVLDLIAKMVRIHDEPVATSTWLSHFLLCRQVAAEGFGSLFGGLGGDELNAGEYEYFCYHFADLRHAGREELLKHEVGKWAEYHDHPVFRKSERVMEEGLARLVDFQRPGRCLPDVRRMKRYFSAVNPEYFDFQSFEPKMEHPFRSFLKNRAFQDIFRETAPCCLRAEDRQTISLGIDHFLPFFDYRLVEFMFRVPGTLKIRNGVTKHILRSAVRGILPEPTRTRIKKTGWNAPAHVWFSGAGCEQVLDLVRSRRFRERGIYQTDQVERLIREHDDIVRSCEPKENHMMFIWQLVNLELWLQSLSEASSDSALGNGLRTLLNL